MMKTSFLPLGLIVLQLLSCSAPVHKSEPDHIIVGVESGPEFKLAQAAQRVAKSKFGLTVELVQFNDYVMPNEALRQGDIDVNVYQNKPYLDIQAKQRGYNFAIVGKTFVYPLAIYSRHIKSLAQLKPGSTAVIPNDPTNSGRSLLLLEKAGLLKLKPGVGLFPTVNDITSNPKNLDIVQMEAPQLTRALDDGHVAIALINSTFTPGAGLIAARDGLFVEDKNSPYVNTVVARAENKNEAKVLKFVKSYESPEVERVAIEEFKGGAIKGW